MVEIERIARTPEQQALWDRIAAQAPSLDGPGPDFLVLYLLLAIGGLILALILGDRLRGDTQDGLTPDDLELLELAWLAGGQSRAVRTVVAGLIEAGEAHLTARSTLFSGSENRVEPGGGPLPDVLAPFRGLVRGHVSQGALHRAVRGRLPPLRADLERRGLVPAAALRARTVRTILLVLGPVVLFGIAGALMQASHGRLIGNLVLAILVTIALGALLIAQLPDCTERGEGTLARYRSRFRRAAEAPGADEKLFAFALGGGAALTDTHLQAYGRSRDGGGYGGFVGVAGGGADGGCGDGGGCGA